VERKEYENRPKEGEWEKFFRERTVFEGTHLTSPAFLILFDHFLLYCTSTGIVGCFSFECVSRVVDMRGKKAPNHFSLTLASDKMLTMRESERERKNHLVSSSYDSSTEKEYSVLQQLQRPPMLLEFG
jgi:hypothetical protein